jgi:hypothetical protein
MTTYEPGTVAVATVSGVPNIRVMRLTSLWYSAIEVFGDRAHVLEDVTDVRRLVALDLDDFHAPTIVGMLREAAADRHDNVCLHAIADQIEAQTKPPKPPKPPKPAEPIGLGAVVEDSDGVRWVRLTDDGDVNKHWRRADMGAVLRHWQIVDAVKVLSNGIKDGAR